MGLTPFTSRTLREHLIRGAFGIAALALAMYFLGSHPVAAIVLGICALIAFRGCPVCWTIGLLDTIHAIHFAGRDESGVQS